jgi:hypothetical protein
VIHDGCTCPWQAGCPLRSNAGGRCKAPGPRAFGNLGDKLDQGQGMPTPRLYHDQLRNGTRQEELRRSIESGLSATSRIQDSAQKDHVDTRSGKFAQSRKPLDTRVKHSTLRCWKVAQGREERGLGEGVRSTYQYHARRRRWQP